MKIKTVISLLVVIPGLMQALYSQQIYPVEIDWSGVREFTLTEESKVFQLYFDGAVYLPANPAIPVFESVYPAGQRENQPIVTLRNEKYETISDNNLSRVEGLESISESVMPAAFLAFERKIPFYTVSFVPLRKNPLNGNIEKLVSFDLEIRPGQISATPVTSKSYRSSSVLSSGNWYKIAVNKTGIHQLTYNDLASMGIPVDNIDPANLRVYGNGGGMLPENLNAFRYDDLMENAIFVSGENDGVFNTGDYILFFGESPNQWYFNGSEERFHHATNAFSDYTYYFITSDLGPGKRIPAQASVTDPATHNVNSFTDFAYYEEDELNLVRTGRTWYDSPPFDITLSYSYGFTFPNLDVSQPVYLRSAVAARSYSSSSFKYFYNGSQVMTANVLSINSSPYSDYAKAKIANTTFNASGPSINLRVDYSRTSTGASGWMDYLEINAIRNLVFPGSQLSFRNQYVNGPGNIAEYTLANANASVRIWNVTDPLNITNIISTLSGSNAVFRLPATELIEFIAFDGSAYHKPIFIKKVENQNLHGLQGYDMIIVSHPSFLGEAYRLADHHINHDGMTVFVVENEKVYNEFSSGAPDVTAIRDFMRMLYDNAAPGSEPGYLLLFGDASYDYKNRISDNTNMVLTWVDPFSLNIINSISTDDYFGFLDDTGTPVNSGLLDIGIGRLPVATQEQARQAVDKIIHYAVNQPAVMASWRNIICFVADDEDGNQHMEDHAERMAKRIDTTYRTYNIDKIYVDAYPQVSTPGGQRAPDVNTAINDRIEKGTLIMNYTGHGGEVGWGHERILEISDINSWTNFDKLAVFVTATCEFSRYDDPERTSAGELVFLNPEGGSVAMFTTARATYGSSNFNLNSALYECIFEKNTAGNYPRFGDVIRMSKNKSGNVTTNDLKFILLGDPALRLAYAENNVVTTSIILNSTNLPADTLRALSKVTVKGEVRDPNGIKLNDYNGILYPTVYDKPVKIQTLASDPSSYKYTFLIRNSILYKGKASVNNGDFSFTFIVPKDIAYQYGFGKISYYASNTSTDAAGYDQSIIVGGYESGGSVDNNGPLVDLYMNDEGFVFGGMTDENPLMLAFVTDSSGVNTVGNGIGHDIVAVLDKNTEKSINLNDYYEADLDSYTSGSIRYPFSSLDEGNHTLSLKVWDVYNNSSETFLEFVVAESAELALDHVLNYPNPFTTHTDFYFEHNRPNSMLEVLLQVFTVSGRLVYTYNDIITTDGFRSGPIPPQGWDGRDDFGDKLARGVYLYKLSVRSMDGSYADKLEKLVILK
ncbi:MAG: type IX secretion system sortase PorU [Bacteroidetes bacterium]|nr:type IX secretion system sortase PorU [Bacteroidota bacterium]